MIVPIALIAAVGLPSRASADDLVVEVHLPSLSREAGPTRRGFEPLWRIEPDGGPVYAPVEAGALLVVVRSTRPDIRLVPPDEPLVISFSGSGESDGPEIVAAPVGATVWVEGGAASPTTVQIEGVAEPVVVEPGQGVPLPAEAMIAPGWLAVRQADTGRECRILKLEAPFLTGRSRLAGAGRVRIELEGDVAYDEAAELELDLGLWLGGQRFCDPHASDHTCDFTRAGVGADGVVVLEPVVLDRGDWPFRPEGP